MDIFHDHRKYLALSWDFGKGHTRYFQFTVLPFGLSSAPFIFTKLLKPLETHWRSQAISIDLPDKSKTTFNNGQKPQKEFIKDKASC